MKVSTASTALRVKRTAVITEGHPVVPMAYAIRQTDVLVDYVEITYTSCDGEWVIRYMSDITVSGQTLKKDGTPSKNHHRRHAPGGYVDEEPWPWLDEIIDLLRPSGNLSMKTLRDYEVTTP